MANDALATRKETRIAPWGDRAEIREIAQRVQLMAPGAKKLSENEALALAQGAVAHGLDPFNGEIWFIPGSGLMTGIKGLRKAAKNQITGNYWPEFSEITDPDERARLFIPKEALAYRCLIRDSDTIRAYSEAWKHLAENKVPVKVIPTLIGEKPYTEGVGYYEVGEKTKMKPVQVAMKRAEADALKRRFDLPFAIPTEPNDMPAIEGDWHEIEEDLAEQAKEGAAALFGEDEHSITESQIADFRSLAMTDPVAIQPTQFWTVAKHFGIESEEGKAIYKEIGNWADALIHVIDKFGELNEKP